jgi:glycosyltransferase involved in cell wall biosynthesis
MILVDATYINSSGGKYLLEYFIDSLCQNDKIENYIFLFDKRFNSDRIKSILDKNIYITDPSEFKRYFKLKKIFSTYSIESIFCFGNVPPPFKFTISCPVYIYFHNVLLIEPWSNKHGLLNRLFLYLKSFYIKVNLNKKFTWIVQSDLVKAKLHSYFEITIDNILVLPFFEPTSLYLIDGVKRHQYFYPAEGVAQKNHNLLLKVWEELSNFNIRPKLILTIDKLKYPKLYSEISKLNLININIENLGFLSRNDIIEQYNKSKFLIFPSLNESFGLPLVEAADLGCHIITPDLDYVNNIIETNIKFDVKKNNLFELIYDIETNKLTTFPSIIKIENKVISLIKLLNNSYV